MVHMSSILPTFLGFTLSADSSSLRFTEVLGSGAYGVVYLAHDISAPHIKYAVKCLLKHPNDSEQARHQDREINYHRDASSHPNVVKFHGVVEEEFYIFLVMDYCAGGDLFSAIIDYHIYVNNDARLKTTFVQIIDSVYACHQKGIFHRDLKSENILCSGDYSQVYLSDFGLATQTEVATSFGCGSSFYMSPECIGSDLSQVPYSTPRSDIWSLGVILVNLITGRNPWHLASSYSDCGYASYLKEGSAFLRRMLSVSDSAAELLTRVFEPKPDARILLPELRAAILAMDTFFPPALVQSCAPLREVDVVDYTSDGYEVVGDVVKPETLSKPDSLLEDREMDIPRSSGSASSDSTGESGGPLTPKSTELGIVSSMDDCSNMKLPKRTFQRLILAVQRFKLRS